MKTKRTLGIMLVMISLSGCASMYAKTEKAWDEKKTSREFLREKALFKERLGGKAPCLLTGLYGFTWDTTERPSAECLYPATRYMYDPYKRVYGQAAQTLQVMQATPQGFLVKSSGPTCSGSHYVSCYDRASPNVIFIHKTDEQDIVDGAQLNPTADGLLYEYTGPFSYETTFGSKTVYSFRKLPRGTVKKALEGLKVYNLDQELFADIGAWPELERAMQPQQESAK
jgi:hypothetical protein